MRVRFADVAANVDVGYFVTIVNMRCTPVHSQKRFLRPGATYLSMTAALMS